jgi:hypothetical protein
MKTKKERQTYYRERGGRGWGRSQITERRESLLFYKSFNTLWAARKKKPSMISREAFIL